MLNAEERPCTLLPYWSRDLPLASTNPFYLMQKKILHLARFALRNKKVESSHCQPQARPLSQQNDQREVLEGSVRQPQQANDVSNDAEAAHELITPAARRLPAPGLATDRQNTFRSDWNMSIFLPVRGQDKESSSSGASRLRPFAYCQERVSNKEQWHAIFSCLRQELSSHANGTALALWIGVHILQVRQ